MPSPSAGAEDSPEQASVFSKVSTLTQQQRSDDLAAHSDNREAAVSFSPSMEEQLLAFADVRPMYSRVEKPFEASVSISLSESEQAHKVCIASKGKDPSACPSHARWQSTSVLPSVS